MALSPLSAGSINAISGHTGDANSEITLKQSRIEHPKHDIVFDNVPESNPDSEELLKSRTQLSPFKGLSPRKSGKSSSKSFTILDEQNHRLRDDEDVAGLRSLSASVKPSDIDTHQTKQEAEETALPSRTQGSKFGLLGGFASHANTDEMRRLACVEYDTFGDGNSEVYGRSTASVDTCFTDFSAVPNAEMNSSTQAAMHSSSSHIRSPMKIANDDEKLSGFPPSTPATSRKHLDNIMECPTPTTIKRPNQAFSEEDATTLLLDFTQQFDACVPSRKRSKLSISPKKCMNEPDLRMYLNNKRGPSPVKASPARQAGRQSLINLLDFDIPPQPTPRSTPTITAREVETLKSSYLSEISHLRACLSGREAEVESLKKAVGDAERRVGEAQESLREEKGARQYAENGKAEWEKKGLEVDSLLKAAKEEFLRGEKENEDLLEKLEESNRLREEAELRAAEANSKLCASQIGTAVPIETKEASQATEKLIAKRVAQDLDERMEDLARELHAVYKKKHENKVSTLKKTYDARAERKCNELHITIDVLKKQNEKLLLFKDATSTNNVHQEVPSEDRLNQVQAIEKLNVEKQSQKAAIAGLKEELRTVKDAYSQLMNNLEQERIEKGELVAAVDEMLALQGDVSNQFTIVEDFKKSVSRPSGLRGPGSGDSKIARVGSFSSAKGSILGKSRMMSSIEKMGARSIDHE